MCSVEMLFGDGLQLLEECIFIGNGKPDAEKFGSLDLLPELGAAAEGPVVINACRHPERSEGSHLTRCFAALSMTVSYRAALANGMRHRQLDDTLDDVAMRHFRLRAPRGHREFGAIIEPRIGIDFDDVRRSVGGQPHIDA